MHLWDFLVSQFASNNFLNAAVIGGVLAGLAISLKAVPKKLWRYFLGKIMTSITIDSKNELFYWLNEVVEELPFYKHRYAFYVFGKKREYEKDEDEEEEVSLKEAIKISIDYTQEIKLAEREHRTKRFLEYIYSPAEGHYIFRHKKRWLFIYFEKETKNSGTPLFTLRLSYFGRSKEFFDGLMDEAEKRYKKFYREKIVLVTNDGWGSWIPGGSRILLSKPIESVVLVKGRMEEIILDIKTFRASEKKYNELGIPYHRTYLFHGIPGTGKTSTIYALANYFNMALFYLNLQIASDDRVSGLFANVNPNSILVIEDIGNIYNKENFLTKRVAGREAPPNYSVFINCLDGFLAKHGALTILTTNHYERLGDALLRPGRIDKQVTFKACDSYQIYMMSYRYYQYMKLTEKATHDRAIEVRETFLAGTITPAFLQKILLEDDLSSNYLQKVQTSHSPSE